MSRWKVPEHFSVLIGGNTYVDCPVLVDYKGHSLFELRRSDADGYLGINFDLHGKDGARIAPIRNGQFVGVAPAGHAIEGSPDHFALVETATGRRICDIRLRSLARGQTELDVSAEMYMPDGQLIVFSPTTTSIGGNSFSGCVFQACGSAIKVG